MYFCDIQVQYLVKWKGWPSDFNSWEDSKDISADLLRDYEVSKKRIFKFEVWIQK